MSLIKKVLATAVSFVPFTMSSQALDVGDTIASFSAKDQNGKEWNSKDYLGKKRLVVYFYPAAMTGGCTKQACAYRDSQKAWADADTIVLGVSGDEPEGLKYFETAEKLNFTLLSDPDGKVAKAFGVPMGGGGEIKRKVEGKEVTLKRGVSAKRWTFVIDKNGKVVSKNMKVNAAKDSANVLGILKGLK